MKLFGRIYDKPHTETLVLPRGDDEPIVFKAQSVLDYSEFEALCPIPVPKKVSTPGGGTKLLDNDEDYLASIRHWASDKMNWMIVKSLTATPGLEWEQVNLSNPSTWDKYEDELKQAFFSANEITLIVNLAIGVNQMNESKLEEARKRFLATQAAQSEQ